MDGQILGWLRRWPRRGRSSGRRGPRLCGPWGLPTPRWAPRSGTWPPLPGRRPPRCPPAQLAAAGFFHTGQQDKVRCFFYGGLQSWEQGDDPWAEHAMWFPRCEFLLQLKGRDFVRSIQDSLSSWGPAEEPEGTAPAAPSGVDAEEQLRRLREERTCRVCLDRTVSIVFMPCGHLACADCAPSLQLCPLCRAPISSRVHTFLS